MKDDGLIRVFWLGASEREGSTPDGKGLLRVYQAFMRVR